MRYTTQSPTRGTGHESNHEFEDESDFVVTEPHADVISKKRHKRQFVEA